MPVQVQGTGALPAPYTFLILELKLDLDGTVDVSEPGGVSDDVTLSVTARGTRRASPLLIARIAGLLYLLIFIAAPSGASSATPLKMAITLVCDIGVACLLYELLRPVSRTLSLLAALFRLIFVVVMGVNSLNYFGITVWFQPARSAAAFDSGYGVSLVPFGIHCVLIGYLIYKSTFLPRILGVMVAAAGFAYLIFLFPGLGSRLFLPWIVIPAVAGEGSLTLWLIIMGVNAERWKQKCLDV